MGVGNSECRCVLQVREGGGGDPCRGHSRLPLPIAPRGAFTMWPLCSPLGQNPHATRCAATAVQACSPSRDPPATRSVSCTRWAFRRAWGSFVFRSGFMTFGSPFCCKARGEACSSVVVIRFALRHAARAERAARLVARLARAARLAAKAERFAWAARTAARVARQFREEDVLMLV